MSISSLDAIGTVVGIVGGTAGIIALVRTWLQERDRLEIRVRPVVDKQALTSGFLLEVVNLGSCKVCITFAGFICTPFKLRSPHLLGGLKLMQGHWCVSEFPYVLEPGLLCRIPINAKELALFESEPIRPIVRLASQKRFLGPLIRDPVSHFAYGRTIDSATEDAIVVKT